MEEPRFWLALLASLIWIGGVATLQFHANTHLFFATFYLAPCVLLALKADRRLGFISATIAGFASPLVLQARQSIGIPVNVTCWNVAMRLFVFLLVVTLLDRVRKQSLQNHSSHTFPELNAIQTIADNWAVILITSTYFALIVVLDAFINPQLILLPFYLLPGVIFTLTLNWRWGTLAAIAAAVAGSLTQRLDDPAYERLSIEFWNILMRWVIFQTVVLLLDRIRHKTVLFAPR